MYPMMITAKPAPKVVLLELPVNAGTAIIRTPIRRMMTPKFLIISLMVIDDL